MQQSTSIAQGTSASWAFGSNFKGIILISTSSGDGVLLVAGTSGLSAMPGTALPTNWQINTGSPSASNFGVYVSASGFPA